MRQATFILAGVALCAAAACGGGADAPLDEEVVTVAVTPDLVRRGRTAYRKYCIQCHGYGGKGDGTSAGSFETPPRDHTDAALMDEISDQTIVETVRFGGAERGFPDMPAFPHVSREELVALAAYVRSLSRPGVTQVEVGDIE